MNQVIYNLVVQLRDEIEASYIAKGLLASGNFGENLTVDVVDENRLQIKAPHYVMQMQNGRRAGTRPPIAAIKQWIKNKNANAGTNIPENAAFAIAYVIERDGIKVPNEHNVGGVVTDIINEQRLASIRDAVVAELRTIIIKNIK